MKTNAIENVPKMGRDGTPSRGIEAGPALPAPPPEEARSSPAGPSSLPADSGRRIRIQEGKRAKRRRRWLPYAGAVVLIGLITAGLWPEPVPVETAQVVAGQLRVTVNEEGKARIKHRYTISAPVTGQLRRIPFKAGYEVKAGETVLAVIEPVAPAILDPRSRKLAEARRDTAAANLERAEAAHRFAASELRRVQQLAQQEAVSVQALEEAQWAETAAAKDLEAARSELRQAEAELLEFSGTNSVGGVPEAVVEVRAPTSGRVLRVFEESVRVVPAGTPLLEIGDPNDLEVVIEVLSRDGAMIMPGMKVELDQWGGPEPLEAVVRLVEPSAFTKISALGVEEQRVNVVADLLTPPEQRGNFGDNFRVEARIITWETDRTLKVPAGALFRSGQSPAVFVIRDGRAYVQPVRTGRSSGVETEILEGLREGDTVIVYPGDRVREGQRVRAIEI